jgi:MoaA/NifB/PqqE/SkfB family radical SAM enzyme
VPIVTRSARAGAAPPAVADLQVRLAPDVKIRHQSGLAFAYVPRRDHFFALDADHAGLARRLRNGRWIEAAGDQAEPARALAELGICETEPPTPRRAFVGRSVVGRFDTLPTSREPLVVNCFATSFCPLKCAYCHADDLMVNYRGQENDRWLARVLRTAGATPAMVGVVTGGEPLARIERTERLIRKLVATGKAVVLDTSGVGDFSRLLPTLVRYRVHVRVSMDSADAAVNDQLRPGNRRFVLAGTSSAAHATDAVRRAVRAGVPCSVQTVVTSRNCDLEGLLALRDKLVALQVATWVLHIVVPVGKAARPAGAELLTGAATDAVLTELIERTAADGLAIDIRLTSTHRAPNSVLLISAKGEIAVENVAAGGKDTFRVPWLAPRRAILRHFRRSVDRQGHASRYLNGSLESYPRSTGAVLPRG